MSILWQVLAPGSFAASSGVESASGENFQLLPPPPNSLVVGPNQLLRWCVGSPAGRAREGGVCGHMGG
jgi:hypothetical protein